MRPTSRGTFLWSGFLQPRPVSVRGDGVRGTRTSGRVMDWCLPVERRFVGLTGRKGKSDRLSQVVWTQFLDDTRLLKSENPYLFDGKY